MKLTATYHRLRRMLPLCGLALLASCGLVELEHSENGKLDGYWHLTTVDTLATGGSLDLRQERFFWIVQGTVFQAFSPDLSNGNGQRYVSHFTYEGDRLTLEKLFFDDRPNGDPAVERVDLLRPFGINQIEGVAFKVEELSGGSMTLADDSLRLTFKKH
ncbi:MAG: lipocalin-like domain-containing protein [Prevotella sp.]|nr:lipocalin-like domain-containing protein [Prevotella sp.]